MAKDHGGHEHLLVLVLHHGDALPVVHDGYEILFWFDVDLNCVHLGIPLLVVWGQEAFKQNPFQ